MKCIKKLKNNKSCGYAGIHNEFLKTSSFKLLIAVTTLFNIVLQTCKIPHAWSIGYISPIYKVKVNDPGIKGFFLWFFLRVTMFRA